MRLEAPSRHRAFTRLILTGCLLLMIFSLLIPPAYADVAFQNQAYIQASVNTNTWTIEAGAVEDSFNSLSGDHPMESKRIFESVRSAFQTPNDGTMGKFGSLITSDFVSSAPHAAPTSVTAYMTPGTTPGSSGNDYSSGVTSYSYLPLTFPGSVTIADGDNDALLAQALTVRDELVPDLQELINIAYPNRPKNWTLEIFRDRMESLLDKVSAVTTGGAASAVVGSATLHSVSQSEFQAAGFEDPEAYADYVRVDAGTTPRYLRWRMPKGFVAISGRDDFEVILDLNDDNPYVTWDMIAVEAFVNYTLDGDLQVTAQDVFASEPTQLERVIVDLLNSFINGLKSLLGLWNIDELVLNHGVRGTSAYVHGVFPATWEPVIWSFFLLAEVLALLFLFYSLIMNIINRAFSTANSMGRMHAWEQTKEILIVAFILAVLPVLIQILMVLSSSLTAVFDGVMSGGGGLDDMRASMASGSGTLSGVVMVILNFGIDIYYNFFYVMRSLTVAVMIILAPIFVVMGTMDDKKKVYFSVWLKELLANIFIQPIHAFIFSIIVLFPLSSHGFDNILLLYATIPFTSAIRSMFFGTGGSWGDRVAERAKNTTTGIAKGVVGGAAVATGAAIGTGVSSAAGYMKGRVSGRGGGAGATAEANDTVSGVKSDFAGAAYATAASGTASGTTGGTAAGGKAGGTAATADAANAARTVSSTGMTDRVFSDSPNTGKPGGPETLDNNNAIKEPKADTGETVSDTKPVDTDEKPVNTRQKPNINIKESAKTAMRGAVGAMSTAAKVAGGIATTAVGGGMAAAGLTQAGNVLEKRGMEMVTNPKGDSKYSARGRGGEAGAGGTETGPEASSGVPVSGSALTPEQRREYLFGDNYNPAVAENMVNPLYQSGKSSTMDNKTTTTMDLDDQKEAGISNVSGDKNNVNYTVDGDSVYGKEMAAYNDILSSMPDDQRKAMVEQTGVDVTPVTKAGKPTGSYQVKVNKENFRAATQTNIQADRGAIVAERTSGQPSVVPMVEVKAPDGSGKVAKVTPTAAVSTPGMAENIAVSGPRVTAEQPVPGESAAVKAGRPTSGGTKTAPGGTRGKGATQSRSVQRNTGEATMEKDRGEPPLNSSDRLNKTLDI